MKNLSVDRNQCYRVSMDKQNGKPKYSFCRVLIQDGCIAILTLALCYLWWGKPGVFGGAGLIAIVCAFIVFADLLGGPGDCDHNDW